MKKKSSIPHASKKKLSKWVKIPLGILTAILVILLAYVIYLYAAYHRIPDNQELAVEAPTEQARPILPLPTMLALELIPLTSAFLWMAVSPPGLKAKKMSSQTSTVPEILLHPKILTLSSSRK